MARASGGAGPSMPRSRAGGGGGGGEPATKVEILLSMAVLRRRARDAAQATAA